MGPQAIRRALIKHFGAQHVDFYCELSGSCYKSEHSVVYAGKCSLYPGGIAIKWVRNAADLAQYDALVEAREKLGSTNEFSVPNAIVKLEKDKIYVMEWVGGKSLSRLLSKEYSPSSDAYSFVKRAGHWLYNFHNMEKHPLSHLPVEQRIRSLRSDVEAAQLEGDNLTQEAFHLLLETMEFARGQKLPQGVIHGDFTPDNILLSDGKTVGLDFDMRFRNVVVLDLANFITHLLLLAWEPAALLHGLFRRRYYLAASFLDGYESNGGRIPYASIAWLKLQMLLQIHAQKRLRRMSLRHWYLIYSIRHEIKRSVRDLTEAVN